MKTLAEEAEVARTDIAFLLPFLSDGGAERVMMDLAVEAAARGRRVDMVVVNHDRPVVTDLGPKVRIVDLNRSRVAFALPALVRYLIRSRAKAVLATIGHTNVLAVVAARLVPGTRVVVREANTVGEDTTGSALKRWAVRSLMWGAYKAANTIIAVSEGVAKSLIEELGVLEGRVRVILNPVITPRVLDGAREDPAHDWFAQGEPPVVLAVGRLVEQKGFDTLIRAFATLRSRQECRLVILGEGRLRSELHALARDLGVDEDVSMPGFVANPFAYMARAELFVLSSRWEGLPNALIQAMAVGTKVVSTDCPSGPSEVTDGGRLAPLVPVDDVRAMADAMGDELAAESTQLPTEWFERYSLQEVATSYLRILEER